MESNQTTQLTEAIADAIASETRIAFVGNGSKPLPLSEDAVVLKTTDHSGILEYRPSELVITVRAGTSLNELKRVTAENGQMLAADPPLFGGRGTIGGAIAFGLSGPGRPWFGSLRDSLLGIEVVNGFAHRLRFGGKVIKNVAGFDISRLFAGSRGMLGLILSTSLKLVPIPESTRSIRLECSDIDSLQVLDDFRRKPSTLSATSWSDGFLSLRFQGASSAVYNDTKNFFDNQEIDNQYWSSLRDHQLSFFQERHPLWRVSLNRGSLFENADELPAISEWDGSQVWVKTESDSPPKLHGLVGNVAAFEPVLKTPVQRSKYEERVRKAFDPHRIFC